MCDPTLLKRLRRENGQTQQQVANRLYITQSTYAYYESGRTKMNLDLIVALAGIYQMNLSAFFFPAEKPAALCAGSGEAAFHALDAKEQKLVILYRSGTPTQRKAVLAAARALVKFDGG